MYVYIFLKYFFYYNIFIIELYLLDNLIIINYLSIISFSNFYKNAFYIISKDVILIKIFLSNKSQEILIILETSDMYNKIKNKNMQME